MKALISVTHEQTEVTHLALGVFGPAFAKHLFPQRIGGRRKQRAITLCFISSLSVAKAHLMCQILRAKTPSW